MVKSKDILRGRHCVHELRVHLVFLPKYRRKVFTPRTLIFIERIFREVCKDFESTVIEFNGENDHVHVLISYPPKISISKLVNSLKGVSSRLLRKEKFPEIINKLWDNAFWSPSYYAGSCGGVTIEQIKKYIENQNAPNSSPP